MTKTTENDILIGTSINQGKHIARPQCCIYY